MVFVLDNYDSFTYNLVQYMGELGAEMVIRRNDELTPGQVEALNPDRILISPGPCTPQEAGISVALLRHFAASQTAGGPRVPILGVCLGHQAIGAAFGGNVIRAPRLMHGKTSPVEHDGKTIFEGIPSTMTCTAITPSSSRKMDCRRTSKSPPQPSKGIPARPPSWRSVTAICPSKACSSIPKAC